MSAFMDWLFDKAPDIDTPPPEPAAHIMPRPAAPHAPDPEEASLDDGPDEYVTEELCVMIDYGDASGSFSRRRVTMLKVKRGPHAPILNAICHERKKFRQFRTDRIKCVIDFDGEVFETVPFFEEYVGVRLADMGLGDTSLAEARAIRDQCRPGLSVLALAALSDEEFHHGEVAAIIEWLRGEVAWLSATGNFAGSTSDRTYHQLARLVSSLRPQRQSLDRHLGQMQSYSPDQMARFQRALVSVIEADGRIAAREIHFANEIDAIREQLAKGRH